MKFKLSSNFIKRVVAVVLTAVLVGIIFGKNLPSAALFDPDKAITYEEFASKTTVEDSVLFIGTYIIHKDALTDDLYQKATDSGSESGQSEIYYKSELSDGQWFETGDIDNGVKGISIEGAPVSIDTINPLYVTYYVGADGILRDAKTMAGMNPFDIPDPYNLAGLPELDPIRAQYTSDSSKTEISQADFLKNKNSADSGNLRSDVYTYQLLSTFFSLDLRDEQTNKLDQSLSDLNNTYIALKAAGQDDEATLVYDLMAKVDATRRAIVMEKLSELDINLLNELYNLCTGTLYTNSGSFKDSSADSEIGTKGENVKMMEDSLSHEFVSRNSISSVIDGWFGNLGVSQSSDGWWTVLDEAEKNRQQKAEEANSDNDDYVYDKTPVENPFAADSALLDAIGTSISNCGDSYTKHMAKALVDSDNLLDHVIYDYSTQVIDQSSSGSLGGPVTYLKHATNIKDNVVNDKDGELALLKSSLLSSGGTKYTSAATAGTNSDYASLSSESAKKSSLEEQKTDEEVDRSMFQFLIESMRQRDTAPNALEYVNDRIKITEALLDQIPEDEFKSYSTSSVQAHIVWLKEEAQKIIDSDESLKSKLDELKEKKEDLQGKRDQCLDNNDLAGAAAFDAKIAAVDQDINDELDRLAGLDGDGSGSGSGSGDGSGSGSGDGSGSGSGDGSGDGSGSGSGDGSGDGSGSGSGSGDGSGSGSGDGSGSGSAVDSLADSLVDKALSKLADDSNADLSGVAQALADVGAEDALDALADKAKDSGASPSTLAGIKDAKDSLNDKKKQASADDLLAQLEALFGKSLDEMDDRELAIAAATVSRLSRSGITPAEELLRVITNKLLSKNNKYTYRQYLQNKNLEYVSLATISDVTSFRYFYDDTKATATMTQGTTVYIFKKGSNQMRKQSADADPEMLSTKTVFQTYVYLSEDDSDSYFGCKAEYLYKTEYSVCVTGAMQSAVNEYVEKLTAFFNQ